MGYLDPKAARGGRSPDVRIFEVVRAVCLAQPDE